MVIHPGGPAVHQLSGKKCAQGVQVMSASMSCSSFKLASFILFLAVNFLMAQVLAWCKQMARVQNRKEGQRIEI